MEGITGTLAARVDQVGRRVGKSGGQKVESDSPRTMLVMPFTWSITNGIGAGFVTYSVIMGCRKC